MPRKIKIISWNLGYWQHREYHECAWEYLRNVAKPDIGLLQEVRAQDLAEGEDLVFREIHNGWGTAIYCRGARKVREIIFSRYPGRVSATEIAIQTGKLLLIASVHAPIIRGCVFPHLDHIFTDIEEAFSGKPSVVGGDLNSARLAEQAWPRYGQGPFFERVDASWFVDIRKQFYEDEIQTYFRPDQKFPFQDDHIFISQDLANQVVSYEVVNNEVTRKVSDHTPVSIEIEI